MDTVDEQIHHLGDWQEGKSDSIELKLVRDPKSILVEESDTGDRWGRSVWIELEDGKIVVHCYDGYHEEPFNVALHEYSTEVWTGQE